MARNEGEEQGQLIGVVPGSFKQAMRIATDHIRIHPDEAVLIKRGGKVLEHVDAGSLVAPVRQSAT